MATIHRRINVTCDPELTAALEATRELLGDLPDSARMRVLALEGARALLAGTPDEERLRALRELLSRPDVTPARNRDRSWLKDRPPALDGVSGTEILEWVRGPR